MTETFRFRDLFDVRRPFASQVQLRLMLREKYHNAGEEYLRSEFLLIFESDVQHTWLVATNMNLYCVFDISKEEVARVRWCIAKEELVRNDHLAVDISTQKLSNRIGHVVIDGQKPRKYSRDLFTDVTINDSTKMMLMNAFKLSASPCKTGDG